MFPTTVSEVPSLYPPFSMYLAILLLPFLGAAFAGLRGRAIGTTGAQNVTTGCIFLTAVLAMVAFYEVGLSGSSVSVELSTWLDAEPLHVSWAFLFDDLTVSMFNKDTSAMFLTLGTYWLSSLSMCYLLLAVQLL